VKEKQGPLWVLEAMFLGGKSEHFLEIPLENADFVVVGVPNITE
jgi:hypothetical protein